jgi:hypothetical protein
MAKKRFLVLGLAILVCFAAPGIADDLKDSLVEGKVSFDLRYRFEFVDQEDIDNNAKASTFRLRLGYTTGKFHGFNLHVDLETIQAVGNDYYDSTDNNRIDFPTVADPPDSELNQAFLSFSGIKNMVFQLGRQRIKLDNDRFIGNVGWRQNEQTYDAFRFISTIIPKTTFTLVYIANVNRIFGEHHSSLSDIDLNAYIVHFSFGSPIGRLSIYNHFLEDQDAPADSHQNLGARFTGVRNLSGETSLVYTLEYAKQSDYKDGEDFIDADYRFFELGVKWNRFTLKGGYEALGGNGVYSFLTPFATLHAFNGWADKFLSTPLDGLVDKYILLSMQAELGKWPLELKGIFHDFRSDVNSIDYGREWDLQAQLDLSDECKLTVKYANYVSQNHATDTTKFWAGIQYRF